MSLLLTPYLLSTAISDSGNEAIRLMIQKPEKSALEAYAKQSGQVPKPALMALQFKELFQASRELQNTIDFYKSENNSLYVRAWQASSNLVVHWYLRNFGRLPPLNNLLKAPYSRELRELKRRKGMIAEQLGHLFECLEGKTEEAKILEDFKEKETLCVENHFYAHLQPTFLQKHKQRLILYGIGAYMFLIALRYVDYQSAINSLNEISVSITNLWETWIKKPLKQVYETIRFSKKDFTIVSPEALQADRGSLDRMITDYASTHKVTTESVEAMLNSGNYSLLINDYENQLRTPIRGALFGSLIRLLLIQVQKGRVDLEGALLILEKIVHANELNFGLVALVPIVTLLYFGVKGIHNKWKYVMGYGHEQNKEKVRQITWRLDRVLCKRDLDAKSKGKCLLLMDQVLQIVEEDKEFEGRVLKDLISLADPRINEEQRHWTLQRLEKGIK